MNTEFDRGVDQMEGRDCGEWASVPYSATHVEVIGPKELHICFFPNTPRGKQIANQIANEHNQHSTLIAQRERLLEVLQLIQGFNWQLDDSPHGQEIRRRAEEAITTIEQEGTR